MMVGHFYVCNRLYQPLARDVFGGRSTAPELNLDPGFFGEKQVEKLVPQIGSWSQEKLPAVEMHLCFLKWLAAIEGKTFTLGHTAPHLSNSGKPHTGFI